MHILVPTKEILFHHLNTLHLREQAQSPWLLLISSLFILKKVYARSLFYLRKKRLKFFGKLLLKIQILNRLIFSIKTINILCRSHLISNEANHYHVDTGPWRHSHLAKGAKLKHVDNSKTIINKEHIMPLARTFFQTKFITNYHIEERHWQEKTTYT